MIPALLAILAAQLAGETLTRLTGLPLPGPVAGMLILLLAFAAFPALVGAMRPLVAAILGNLSLLYVPAGTGVVGHLDSLMAQGPALLAVLVVSTVAAIASGALVFVAVAWLTGAEDAA